MLPLMGINHPAPTAAEFKEADLDGNGKLNQQEMGSSKWAIKLIKLVNGISR